MNDRQMMLNPGERIGAFKIISELGRGNNGVVYLAEQELLDREVALKLLLPELADTPEHVSQLMREARAAARLNHPNIVQALDAGSENGMCYLALEYVRGRTLEDIRLNSPEQISLEFLISISIQLADALEYAWENFSMTHGDIKPENLLICDDRRTLKLADLGLAHVSGRSGEDDGFIMATPMYASPEVISGDGEIGVRSDIYSFGVMFYELIAGKPPFLGDTDYLLHCHLEELPPPLSVANPDIPRELAAFTHQMLEKNPGDRPSSWSEIKKFMEEFRDRQIPNGAAPASLPAELQSSRREGVYRPLVWIGIAIGALAAISTAVLFLLSSWLSRR